MAYKTDNIDQIKSKKLIKFQSKNKPQTIQDYCKEHRCWAAKDAKDNEWHSFNKRPEYISMAQCLNFGKSVNDLGYGMFLNQLQYKTFWNNKILIEADKWFASSKTCSKCGFVYKNLKLSNRTFKCPSYGFEIDRDQNAGINLKNYGLKKIGLGQSNFKPVEKRVLKDSSLKQETVKTESPHKRKNLN